MKMMIKRIFSLFLSGILIISLVSVPVSAAGKVKLSSKKITLTVGKSKKIKLSNNKKKVTWKVIRGKSSVSLKRKSKSGVTIAAKKKTGTAIVQAKIGKAKYNCKVIVTKKNAAKKKKTTSKKKRSQTTAASAPTAKPTVKPTAGPAAKNPEEAEEKLILEIGRQKFEATLYNNKTTRAWKKKLPMTIKMSDLNRNEKYYYLSYSLPTKAEKPGTIQAGDLKLYGSDCLVLFYKTFKTSYSYTKLARVNNITGLENAIGRGTVSITFKLG